MCTSSSRCRMRSCRSAIGIVSACTPGCSRRARRRSARSRPIPDIWAPRSGCSAFFTRGGRRWSAIPTYTASCRPVACLRIISAGFIRKYADFFLPVKVLSRVFRGKFVEALRRAYDRNELDLAGATEPLRDPAQWHAFVDALFTSDWVVYAKPAFGGASAVLRYLGRYHASSGDQQSPTARLRRRPGFISVEGLRAREPVVDDDAVGDGVSPPLRPTHSPAWFRSHPTVGVSGEHLSRGPRGTRTDAPRHTSSGGRDGRAHDADHRHVTPRLVGVSPMRRRDDRRADPLGDPPRDGHMEFRHLMSPSLASASAPSTT